MRGDAQEVLHGLGRVQEDVMQVWKGAREVPPKSEKCTSCHTGQEECMSCRNDVTQADMGAWGYTSGWQGMSTEELERLCR